MYCCFLVVILALCRSDFLWAHPISLPSLIDCSHIHQKVLLPTQSDQLDELRYIPPRAYITSIRISIWTPPTVYVKLGIPVDPDVGFNFSLRASFIRSFSFPFCWFQTISWGSQFSQLRKYGTSWFSPVLRNSIYTLLLSPTTVVPILSQNLGI